MHALLVQFKADIAQVHGFKMLPSTVFLEEEASHDGHTACSAPAVVVQVLESLQLHRRDGRREAGSSKVRFR